MINEAFTIPALFWSHAVAAIVCSLLCVTRKSPVASAMWLILTLFMTAVMYVLLDAHFIAALQVMVYSGAIMVLFLFVIMLLNLGDQLSTDMRGWFGRGMAFGLAALVGFELWIVTGVLPDQQLQVPAGTIDQLAQEQGAVGSVANALYTGYLVPFEMTTILLLAAIAGAVVLAKRKI